MEKNKISIIGCGAVAELMYLPAIKQIENIEIVNLVDLNKGFRDSLAKKFNLDPAICCDSLPLSSSDGEIALVLVPTGLHEKVTIDCLNKGYHVMCEKPLAANMEEVVNLIEVSNEKNRHLSVGMARHFMPHNLIVKDLIQNKTFGEPKKVYFEEGGAFAWPIKTMARFDSKASGNGAVLNGTASHLIDLILWWFGDNVVFDEFIDDSNGGLDINCNIKFDVIMKDNSPLPVEGLISMTGNLKNNMIIFFEDAYLEVPIFPNEDIIFHSPFNPQNSFNLNPYKSGTEYGYDSIRRHIIKFINAINDEELNSDYVRGDTQIALTKLIDDAYSNRKKFNLSWM